MKKMMILLVMMFMVVLSSYAQIIKDITGTEIILSNGYVYSCRDIPGSQWMKPGDNMSVKIQNYFNYLRRSDLEEYSREYNLYITNPPQPIRTTTGMMVGVGMVGGVGYGGAMYGTGVQNTGMVMGAGGMAGATSNVEINNGNMVSTIGSGINMMYDTGTNSLNITGDPLMAVGRVVSGITASKKARKAQQQAQQQNVRIVYVDASTGQIIGQQQPVQQVQYVQQQPQTQVVYNATTGQYVQQQTQPVQQVRQQTVQQQTVRQQQTTTNNVGAATTSDYSTGF